jgi:cation transport ATPase
MASLRLSVECQDLEAGQDHWIQHLFDAVTVRSWTRGRIRFHLGFEGDEVLADTLRRELQKLDSVRLESYSIRTRNALVTFDPAKVGELALMTALLRGITEFARVHGECDLEHHHHESRARASHAGHAHEPGHEHEHGAEEDCDHDHSATSTDAGIRKELLKLVLTGGALGYFVYRRVKGKPITFKGNPLLDLGSLITIASGYSIFRAGVDSVQKHKKATDDTLISIACWRRSSWAKASPA